MQNLKYFFKILNAHKVSVIAFVALFAGLMVFFSETGTDMTDAFVPTSLDVAIVNRDNHPISDGLAEYLGTKHNIVEVQDDEDAKRDALFFWDAVYILIIDEGFGTAFYNDAELARLSSMQTPTFNGFFVDGQIESYLTTLQAYLTADFGVQRAIAYSARVQEASVRVLDQDNNYGMSFYFQYMPFILVSVIILALGSVMIVYKKEELARRMDISPTPAVRQKAQLMAGCIVCAALIWILAMVGAHFICPNPLTGTVGLLRMLNSLVFAVVCVSIAFLIGQCVKKMIVLQALVQILGLGLSFISGVFVPQALLADGVLAAARFAPVYWYVRSNDMLNAVTPAIEADMGLYLQGVGIQLGFAVALFAVALVLGREKRVAA